jgi:hypothetical protein
MTEPPPSAEVLEELRVCENPACRSLVRAAADPPQLFRCMPCGTQVCGRCTKPYLYCFLSQTEDDMRAGCVRCFNAQTPHTRALYKLWVCIFEVYDYKHTELPLRARLTFPTGESKRNFMVCVNTFMRRHITDWTFPEISEECEYRVRELVHEIKNTAEEDVDEANTYLESEIIYDPGPLEDTDSDSDVSNAEWVCDSCGDRQDSYLGIGPECTLCRGDICRTCIFRIPDYYPRLRRACRDDIYWNKLVHTFFYQVGGSVSEYAEQNDVICFKCLYTKFSAEARNYFLAWMFAIECDLQKGGRHRVRRFMDEYPDVAPMNVLLNDEDEMYDRLAVVIGTVVLTALRRQDALPPCPSDIVVTVINVVSEIYDLSNDATESFPLLGVTSMLNDHFVVEKALVRVGFQTDFPLRGVPMIAWYNVDDYALNLGMFNWLLAKILLTDIQRHGVPEPHSLEFCNKFIRHLIPQHPRLAAYALRLSSALQDGQPLPSLSVLGGGGFKVTLPMDVHDVILEHVARGTRPKLNLRL